MKATYHSYTLQFKRPSGTSRGVLTAKETFFLKIAHQGKTGIGECGLLRGLSIDDRPDYEEMLQWLCDHINQPEAILMERLQAFPSIRFGLEMALRSLRAEHPFVLQASAFTEGKAGIPINGLIWMGEKAFMKEQIEAKLAQGFSCIKLKIGAIDFAAELDLLSYIRSEYSSDIIELRVDANGAFSPKGAMEKLRLLAELDLHSIEQPVKQGQWSVMQQLCATTPLPIALDEELIGVFGVTKKEELLQTIQPQYIVLKPSLVGGYCSTREWINLADKMNIGWWITSALESNIGLNALAQFTYMLDNDMPQGLGTGSLYVNNIDSPLEVVGEKLHYHPDKVWDVSY